ncbi:hypothetical protein Tco_1031600 [Tanacetum coccineum]|uniref:Uncharacterized protein n=1 Tax=Tanacetum coccineum TaxID=301880 RepID=A0ABQ5GAA5_9ASTR
MGFSGSRSRFDSGCSKAHRQGNMSYLTNYEDIDEGYVAFGGNPKGGNLCPLQEHQARGGWWSRDGDEGGGGCDGGRRVVATGAVAARGGGDRVDRVMGRLLGLGRKTRRKSGGCGGGRNVGRKR